MPGRPPWIAVERESEWIGSQNPRAGEGEEPKVQIDTIIRRLSTCWIQTSGEDITMNSSG